VITPIPVDGGNAHSLQTANKNHRRRRRSSWEGGGKRRESRVEGEGGRCVSKRADVCVRESRLIRIGLIDFISLSNEKYWNYQKSIDLAALILFRKVCRL